MEHGPGLGCRLLFQDRQEAFEISCRKNFQQRCDWREKLGIIDSIIFYDSFGEHGQYGKLSSPFVP